MSKYYDNHKNELPQECWEPWLIPPLMGGDPNLCSVRSLWEYLDHTHTLQSGPLFRCLTSERALTPAGIRTALTSIIKKSNPDSVPKGHDIRKIASSYTFFEDMHFSSSGIKCLYISV